MIDLTGKTALITGAASGIGYGMAKRLAECGANVALCDIQTDIHDIANEIASATNSEVKAAVSTLEKHPKFSHLPTKWLMNFLV